MTRPANVASTGRKQQRRRYIALTVSIGLLVATQWPAVGAVAKGTSGYYLAAADGAVYTFGEAPYLGSPSNLRLAAPIVGITATSGGYYLVGADGGVFTYGTALFYGSAAHMSLSGHVVGLAPIAADSGYLIATSNGEVVQFLDDQPPQIILAAGQAPGPVVGIGADTGNDGGFYLVTSNGAVVADRGVAIYAGSTEGMKLNRPIVGVGVGGANGNKYELYAGDGGVFAFGRNLYHGSAASYRLKAPIVGGSRTTDGYYLVGADGGVFAFGNASFYGSEADVHLDSPIVGIAATYPD